MPEYKVQLRGGYSDRMGIKPISTKMQTTSFNHRTRIALTNLFKRKFDAADNYRITNDVYYAVLTEVYLQPTNSTFSLGHAKAAVYDTLARGDYDDVLTVLEFLAPRLDKSLPGLRVKEEINKIFEQEYVGYRLINGQFVSITSKHELDAIEQVLVSPHDQVNDHISKALSFLSDRQSPDYENSIKESITAVERMCAIILEDSLSLGEALKKLEGKGLVIHPSLRSAFDKLFGYTSNASGIRHAGQLGGSDATFEEAQFMLVSCSAFINYLRGTMAKQGIKR